MSSPSDPQLQEEDKLSDILPDVSSRGVSLSDSRAVTPQPGTSSGARKASHLRKEIQNENNGGDVTREADDIDSEEEQREEEVVDAMDVDQDTGKSPNRPTATPSKRQQQEERRAQNRALEGRKGSLETKKLADSMKRFSYLMGQTELFEHFLEIKKERDPEFRKMIENQQAKKDAKGKKKEAGTRHRKSEKEEDEELLHDDDEEDEGVYVYDESPAFVKGGKMRDYQVAGLNWMASLHHNGINGILADEMGLGKTLQTIAFLGHLKVRCDTTGPHLIVVPKSTLNNWDREVAKWVPGFNTIVLQGAKEDRAVMIKDRIMTSDFDILITSYEMCLREKSVLQRYAWEYIIIDEAHRIKNVDSLLSQIVRSFTSRGRLLITGTPLQNNLQELWALLNFILPDVFSSSEDFDAWFKGKGESDEQQQQVVSQLHKVLRPFLLRRVKSEVEHSLLPKKEINLYVGMSDMQKRWYKSLLEKDIDAVNGAAGKKEGKTRLLNIVMQLRKCCNHPYLFDGAEPGPPYTTDEHLVDNSDKMRILDRLLKRMMEKGSRVLIFSQMSRVLDILEDYCQFRGYKYCRIDGGTDHDTRTQSIDEYNKPGSDKFIFLLTTRAGGLGINLVSADIVVLFDSDWNPQADLQAMDRAHRIGQTKQVYVYRFITKDAIEERVIERAMQKLKLDQMVIQAGRAQPAAKSAQNKDDLLDMIQHGAGKIINSKESLTVDDDIEKIIREGEERTAELNKKYEGMNLDALTNFQPELGTREWEGQTYTGFKSGGPGWIDLGKRQAKEVSYAVDQYFSNAMKGNQPPKDDKPKVPKAPKQIDLQAHQFFPPRLAELQEREMNAWRKENNIPAERPETKEGSVSDEQVDKLKEEAQAAIDSAEPLTEEEREEKSTLADQVFTNWNKPELRKFLELSGRYGRTAYTAIAAEMDNKTEDDLEAYAGVYWQRYKEIPGWESYMKKYDDEEKRREKLKQDKDVLHAKISTARYPLQKLDINYGQNKGKQYSEDEDRFLLVRLNHYGLERDYTYDMMKRDIGEWPDFRFNWFIKSRTPEELKRRCAQLMTCLYKDVDGKPETKAAAAVPKKRKTEDSVVASRDVTPAAALNGKSGSKKRK